MESIFFIYQVGKFQHLKENILDPPNAIEVQVPKGKEVYLQDFLISVESFLGTNYSFFASREANLNPENFVSLESPLSVVPILSDNHAYLFLDDSTGNSFVPQTQHLQFTRHSRHQIYSQLVCNLLEDEIAKKSSISSSNTSFDSRSHFPAFSASSSSTSFSSSNLHEENSFSSFGSGSHSTNSSGSGSGVGSGIGMGMGGGVGVGVDLVSDLGAGLQHIVNDETVAALTEGTKTVVKNLFSFAAMSLKTVSEAATNLTQISKTIQVGRTKVQIIREIAEGGFGKVYLAQDPPLPPGSSSSSSSGSQEKQYALKQTLCQSREQIQDAEQELQALQRFSRASDHIIHLLDHSVSSGGSSSNSGSGGGGGGANAKTYLFLFPLYTHGTCWDALERVDPYSQDLAQSGPWPFTEKRALEVIRGTALALQAIHEQGYAHRDIKPHNILLSFGPAFGSGSGSRNSSSSSSLVPSFPVLMDLGSVTRSQVNISNRRDAMLLEEEAASKTSAAYRAPELTSISTIPCVVDEKVDIWGLGCTLYCLAFGHSPFENSREGILRLAILNGKYSFPSSSNSRMSRMRDCVFSESFQLLIEKMIQVDASRRPSALQVADEASLLMKR